MKILNVDVTVVGFTPYEGELENYVHEILRDKPDTVRLKFTANPDDPDDIIVGCTEQHLPFERIRRITGYLVGTLDRWNNSKQAEERDRVKHETRL